MADLVVTIGGQPAAYRAGTLSISGSLGTRTTASLQTVDHPPFDDVWSRSGRSSRSGTRQVA
jgi:hypothetical protein